MTHAHVGGLKKLLEAFSHLAERLDQNGSTKVFHQTTVSRAVDVLALADDMNFTDDPTTAQLISEIRSNLDDCILDARKLRERKGAREKTCQKLKDSVKAITDTFGGLL